MKLRDYKRKYYLKLITDRVWKSWHNKPLPRGRLLSIKAEFNR